MTALIENCPSEGTKLAVVMGYEHPWLVKRLQEKLSLTPEAAQSLFDDTKRFLYLCGVSPRRRLVPSPAIDDGWHHFLMFTEDYQSFCQTYFGRFIHHRPRRFDDPPSDGSDLRFTLNLALETYGDSLSSNWKYGRLSAAPSSNSRELLTVAGAACDSCGCTPCGNDSCNSN